MPITLSELHDIRSDCFADDIAIDEVLMREWSHDEARQHFESGGTCFPIVIPSSTPTVIGSPAAGADRHALLMSLGACLPNAPLPNVPLEEAEVDPAKWAPCTTSGPVPGPSACPQSGRIFCVSDLHTDYAANMEWCRQLADSGSFVGDVLIVAGDVTASLPLLRETLELLSRAFAKVFLTPGNHDLWVKGRANQGGLHIRPKPISSLEKLEEIRQLCAQIGVATAPEYACGAIVAPIYSWYHAEWDKDPEIIGWEGIPAGDQCLMDFFVCEWPSPLSKRDDSLARHFDRMNDQPTHCSVGASSLEERIHTLRDAHPGAPLITCSHFVPRTELNPEKRFLFFPSLAKACGSDYLARRIATLRPAVHVFGHTHFGWDATLDDGVRYLQAPLSYPEERQGRLGTVATGEFPHATPPAPLLVYDARSQTYPPRYDAGWSNFYRKYQRRPDLCHLLPPYSARQYKRIEGVGAVGWFAAGDNPTSDADGATTPAWAMGPASAVRVELALRQGSVPHARKAGSTK